MEHRRRRADPTGIRSFRSDGETFRLWTGASKRQNRSRNSIVCGLLTLLNEERVVRLQEAHRRLVADGWYLEAEGLEEVLSRIDPGEAEAAKGARQDAARMAAETRAAGGSA